MGRDYFLSDVHLRLDQPDRGDRLASLIDRLKPTDALTIVGDLCDFWFAARQQGRDPMRCRGLRALADFRDRGGATTILAGNHDAWLGRFYERTLGATFLPDGLERSVGGRRTLITHGHRLGARTTWKAGLESRAFLAAFRLLPDFVADRLGEQLRRTNEAHQDEFDQRGREVYEKYVAGVGDRYDLVILGHVHRPLDTGESPPRLVILGGWHDASAYLVVDGVNIQHHVDRVKPSSEEIR